MHEFEALLFSECRTLSESLGAPSLEASLRRIREAFATPEDINDSPRTAPSKRLLDLMSEESQRYEKPTHGFIALDDIGLPTVRAECPHFDAWLRRLEGHAPGS